MIREKMRKWLFFRRIRRELFKYHLEVAEYAFKFGIFGALDKKTIKFSRARAANMWRANNSR